jgi:hypothetical protein
MNLFQSFEPDEWYFQTEIGAGVMLLCLFDIQLPIPPHIFD